LSGTAAGFFPQEQPFFVGECSGKTGKPFLAYQSAAVFMSGSLIALPLHEPVHCFQSRNLKSPPTVLTGEFNQWGIAGGTVRFRVWSGWKSDPPGTLFLVERAIVNDQPR
jgi:hypothetical protein